MTDTFEFTLNNPLTEEQWDMIEDVDFDHTDSITFHTKHGKEVKFAKVIRCKDCKYWHCDDVDTYCYKLSIFDTDMNSYCSYAERKEE